MEQISDHMDMLHALSRPAFCVKDGIIVKVNAAAAGLLIDADTPVAPLLETGAEEYAAFCGGCLCLTLSLFGHSTVCSVTRMGDFDLFCLEEEDDRSLKMLALSAQGFRSPLQDAITSASRMFALSDQDDPEIRKYAAQLNRAIRQMHRLVNNMSDAAPYCSNTSGRQELRDICSVINEIFEKTAALLEQAGTCLTYEGHPESIYSLVDSDRLERAILNIISNARKFNPDCKTIQAKLTRRGSKLYLSIQDSGSGIDESLKATLFSRYRRRPGLEDGRYGIGLGMLLIHSIAAQHGGTVLIDQPGNSGLRVTMSLPIRQKSADQFRTPVKYPDYAGEYDHALLELSDILPAELYS